jgi:hypothetical protein
MQRARTLSGLLVQFFRMRWNALGKVGKSVVVVAIAIAAVAAVRVAMCGFGGCAAGPCELSSTPCARAAESNEPCPYSAAHGDTAADTEAEPQADTEAEPQADTPPCHANN